MLKKFAYYDDIGLLSASLKRQVIFLFNKQDFKAASQVTLTHSLSNNEDNCGFHDSSFVLSDEKKKSEKLPVHYAPLKDLKMLFFVISSPISHLYL